MVRSVEGLMPDMTNIIVDEEVPLKSKKFIAFLLSELTWKAIIVLTLVFLWNRDQLDGLAMAILMTLILVTGFVEVGFILGQASLDKFIRLAKIAAVSGSKIRPRVKGMEVFDEDPGKPG